MVRNRTALAQRRLTVLLGNERTGEGEVVRGLAQATGERRCEGSIHVVCRLVVGLKPSTKLLGLENYEFSPFVRAYRRGARSIVEQRRLAEVAVRSERYDVARVSSFSL